MDSKVLLLLCIMAFSTPVNTAPVPYIGNNSSLSPALRVFAPAQLQRVMLKKGSAERDGIQCPSANVVHENLGAVPGRGDVLWVPHSLIVQNGERCGTGRPTEYMLLVNGADIAKREVAKRRGLEYIWNELQTNKRGVSSFNSLNAIDQVSVGIEATAHRQCGGKVVFPRGSVFLFISPSITNINLGFAYFPKHSVGMLTVLNNQNLCAYVNGKPRHSDKNPTPSPVKSLAPPPARPFALKIPNISLLSTPNPGSPIATTVSPSPSKTPARKAIGSKGPVPSASPSKSSPPQVYPSPSPSPSQTKKIAPSVPPTPSSSPVAKKIDQRSTNSSKTCFPNSGSVELASGKKVAISALQEGDRVRTGPNSFSDVFMFTHKDENAVSEFVRIEARSGAVLEISGGHYIPVNGGLSAARDVKLGDKIVLASGESDCVDRLSTVYKRGLHNPQTIDGKIVVDGVVCSTFTEAIIAPVASALLAPLRAMYSVDLWKSPISGMFHQSDRGAMAFLPSDFSGFGQRVNTGSIVIFS